MYIQREITVDARIFIAFDVDKNAVPENKEHQNIVPRRQYITSDVSHFSWDANITQIDVRNACDRYFDGLLSLRRLK